VRLKLTLAYDGTAFSGWAAQPGLRTVEAVVRDALGGVFGEWRDLAVAGRTDAGVHAFANVCSVDVDGGPPTGRVPQALNALLPDDVAVVSAAAAPDDFDARFSAQARSYRYRVWCSSVRSPFEAWRSWWHPRPVELDALEAAAADIVGEHDFRAFTPTETQHSFFTRVVESARWSAEADLLVFEITGNSFLRHMVRTLVGTMLDGLALAPLLDGGARSDAGRTAPPWGLYLTSVRYY
jgi:tRNA pseudouridine38-40 synthase